MKERKGIDMSDSIAIIFTRHQFTGKQQEEFERICKDDGIDIESDVIQMRKEASLTLTTRKDAEAIVDQMIERCLGRRATDVNIFGVIPPVLRSVFWNDNLARPKKSQACFWVYEAHSVNRAEEGEAPKFEFDSWVLTGGYRL
jgi:hypothetical protein